MKKWTSSAKQFLSSPVLCMAVACGGGAPAEPKKEEAKKDEVKAEAEDAGVAKRKAEREAKAKAAAELEEKKKAKIGEITVLPAGKLPKKIDKACEDVNTAYDGFMRKWYPDDIPGWESKKGTQLGLLKKTCLGGSIEAAACQANALSNSVEELKKEIPTILSTCIEKFPKK